MPGAFCRSCDGPDGETSTVDCRPTHPDAQFDVESGSTLWAWVASRRKFDPAGLGAEVHGNRAQEGGHSDVGDEDDAPAALVEPLLQEGSGSGENHRCKCVGQGDPGGT